MAKERQRDVRVYCAARDIRKKDFAQLAGVSLRTLYRWLRGEPVRQEAAKKIYGALKDAEANAEAEADAKFALHALNNCSAATPRYGGII